MHSLLLVRTFNYKLVCLPAGEVKRQCVWQICVCGPLALQSKSLLVEGISASPDQANLLHGKELHVRNRQV